MTAAHVSPRARGTGVTSSERALWPCSCRCQRWSWFACRFRQAVVSGVVEGGVAGQLAVGAGLGQEVLGLWPEQPPRRRPAPQRARSTVQRVLVLAAGARQTVPSA